MLHGLRNGHRWSDRFLKVVVDEWGSGHVYVIYANNSNQVRTRSFDGDQVTFIGRNDGTAGTPYVADWNDQVHEKVQILQKEHGLSQRFNIIAHSQGGLVARKYIYDHPHTVAGLVTLGTPHHGSPLAKDFAFFAKYVVGGEKAQSNLKPIGVEKFNRRYPVEGASLFHGGNVYTIRGDADGYDTWGVSGENFAGWHVLFAKYQTDSDGLVPTESAYI
ncbi:MAG: alpha/beta fold hydrolase [Firmicutes bacterium]|nr:alpha/beta fold hydrolase [Bacillota bacterium]